jgi:aminopeptidase N
MARKDPHSYHDSTQPLTRHLDLDLRADFGAHRLEGDVVLRFAGPSEGPLDLDTRGLDIRSVADGAGAPLRWESGPEDEVLGSRLRIEIPKPTDSVRIAYATSADASALQWLTPVQTLGKRHPYLFSQCQAIHARSMVPCQDSPRARVTYTARFTVPEGLTAVMSAGSRGSEPGSKPGTRTFLFDMPQAIPPYLLAVAAGEIASRDLSPRCRIYAEPGDLDAAAWEFAEIEEFIRRAEGIFGPYEWDRYDMLVLPPSFPYGGMENPRLTFLTPTLLAGDRSLVAVVAHELAHSWTGNLVTNASAEDFWLNEGFTVWAERRILEAVHGPDFAVRCYAIGRAGLDAAMARFGATSPLTRLRTEMTGVHPDDAFSEIPYEKGARFVVLLERAVGRERFDRFILDYIRRFRFTSITTEEFLAFLEEELPGTAERVGAQRWLYEPGLPEDTPKFHSAKLEAVKRLAAALAQDYHPSTEETAGWDPQDLLLYLQRLPRPLPETQCAWLDGRFGLHGQGNYEILVEWLTIAAASDYAASFPNVREVLSKVGRMKFLRALYGALGASPRTRALAREIFDGCKETLHPTSRRVIEGMLAQYPS